MDSIFVDQVGYLSGGRKRAVMNFKADKYELVNMAGESVYEGRVTHFGPDEISGEDAYICDFSDFDKEGDFHIESRGVNSVTFSISSNVYDDLLKDLCKCFYFLRCSDALDEKYAGLYYHKPCHMNKAIVYGEDTEPIDVRGGWHDAGDYGRYSTAGAVAVTHLLHAVRFFKELLDIKYDIPLCVCDKGHLPCILAEVKIELDFLMKMQRDDGAVWHKVTTFNHAEFIMPEDDHGELYLFPVSSIATADVAGALALAYTVYKEFDRQYAEVLMEASLRSYKWLSENPEPLLFTNAPGSNTGEYGEEEDISNRYFAACALYDATGDDKYLKDAGMQAERLEKYESESAFRHCEGDIFTCLGWGYVAGLGSFSLILKDGEDELTKDIKDRVIKEADRLISAAGKNGFGLCMGKDDFIWGSNMELLKYMMILTVADRLDHKAEYCDAILAGIDYLLGCNSMDISYVTGNGEKAYRNPHLRPTACDGIDDPWPGLVSGGPNKGLHDEKAKELPAETAPMKCYIDNVDCYSLNEITIYWNSPFVFVLAGMLSGK